MNCSCQLEALREHETGSTQFCSQPLPQVNSLYYSCIKYEVSLYRKLHFIVNVPLHKVFTKKLKEN
jgi:hypothetical protein